MPNEHMTLHAKWTRANYQIIYVLGSDNASNDNPTSYQYGVGVSTLKAPSKVGATFDYWYTDPNDPEGSTITSISDSIWPDRTLCKMDRGNI